MLRGGTCHAVYRNCAIHWRVDIAVGGARDSVIEIRQIRCARI